MLSKRYESFRRAVCGQLKDFKKAISRAQFDSFSAEKMTGFFQIPHISWSRFV